MSNDQFYGPDKFPKASESFKKENPHIFEITPDEPPPSFKGLGRVVNDKFELKSEKELQKLIYQDLLRRGLYFHYQRTDKPTTGTVGTPDFILPYKGYFIALECKTETGRLRKEQAEVLKQIEAQGGLYYVVRSFDDYQRLMQFGRLQTNFSDNEVP